MITVIVCVQNFQGYNSRALSSTCGVFSLYKKCLFFIYIYNFINLFVWIKLLTWKCDVSQILDTLRLPSSNCLFIIRIQLHYNQIIPCNIIFIQFYQHVLVSALYRKMCTPVLTNLFWEPPFVLKWGEVHKSPAPVLSYWAQLFISCNVIIVQTNNFPVARAVSI